MRNQGPLQDANIRALTFRQVMAMGLIPARYALQAEWEAAAACLEGLVTFDLRDPDGLDRLMADVVTVGRGLLKQAELALRFLPHAPPGGERAAAKWDAMGAALGAALALPEAGGETAEEAILRMAETPSDRVMHVVRKVGWPGLDLLVAEHADDPAAAIHRLAGAEWRRPWGPEAPRGRAA